MKKYLLLTLLFTIFYSCSNESEPKKEPPEPQTPPETEISLFNLDRMPSITLEFELQDWNKFLSNFDENPQNEKKLPATYSFSDGDISITLDSIGVKPRGNTSRRRPEGNTGEAHNAANPDWHHCHFGLDFSQFRDKQRFEGLNKLILKWFKDDPNYCREVFCYNLFALNGVWTAPRVSYCRLTVNVKGDPKPAYFGIYTMIESIDEDFIEYRKSEWSNAQGFLWKGGWAGSNNADFVSTESIGIEDVKMDASKSKYYAYDLKNRKDELDDAKTQLIQFITDINTKTGADFKTFISEKMDINLFLKTYATNVAAGMWDDYWVNANNFYFYFAGNGKAYFIPYDYDNTLGTSLLINDAGTQNPLRWGKMDGRPLITKILEFDDFKIIYINYLKILIAPENNLFDYQSAKTRIQGWQTMIQPYVSNDSGEDMTIYDAPAAWSNKSEYRLLSGSEQTNFFRAKAASINSIK
ncbi:MAG: CotH kinase family protein [Prevotellaceae bacterium]|jgi:spore coat protein CotH|nr:CotH kinase family protein [Prevotellaceae bacterium]